MLLFGTGLAGLFDVVSKRMQIFKKGFVNFHFFDFLKKT